MLHEVYSLHIHAVMVFPGYVRTSITFVIVVPFNSKINRNKLIISRYEKLILAIQIITNIIETLKL